MFEEVGRDVGRCCQSIFDIIIGDGFVDRACVGKPLSNTIVSHYVASDRHTRRRRGFQCLCQHTCSLAGCSLQAPRFNDAGKGIDLKEGPISPDMTCGDGNLSTTALAFVDCRHNRAKVWGGRVPNSLKIRPHDPHRFDTCSRILPKS